MKTVRIGMIGAGQIAYEHCRSINTHPQAEVVAVADPSEKRAKKLANQFDFAKVYDSAEALAADADIDAVSIAIPNAFHAPVALGALKAGKHVQMDKPFALSLAEAKKVVRAAERSKKVFTLGMNWRFRPEVQTVRRLVERGELGEVYHAKSCVLRRTGIPRFGTWFCSKELAGGGALLDIGVHFLDCCLYLLDEFEPAAVSGAAYTRFGDRGLGEGTWGMSDSGKLAFDVDDFATALIKLKSGATVQLDASWALHLPTAGRMQIELFGTRAGAGTIPEAKLYRPAKRKGEYEVAEIQNVKPIHPHHNRHHNWINAILGTEKLACTLEQALAVQSILDAIYASSETGREVRFKS
jgi:predicted dehydrogenase